MLVDFLFKILYKRKLILLFSLHHSNHKNSTSSFSTHQRYALLTVDTEALPLRASTDHVARLIWGKHENGKAGIEEMCSIGDAFSVKHVFFVDMCGAYTQLEEMIKVVQFLNAQKQDVQLHAHPEYLPDSFWKEHKISKNPRHFNKFSFEKSKFIIEYFSKLLSNITKKPIISFRAGSFRWNSATLQALKTCNIPLSFNNSMRAVLNKQCQFSLPTCHPYAWSNALYEIPMTEKKRFLQNEKWDRLQYPTAFFLRYLPRYLSFIPYTIPKENTFVVALMHSWSFLERNNDGHAIYVNDKAMQGYYSFVKRLSKDYDIITSQELLDLIQSGKIKINHTENVQSAVLKYSQAEINQQLKIRINNLTKQNEDFKAKILTLTSDNKTLQEENKALKAKQRANNEKVVQ